MSFMKRLLRRNEKPPVQEEDSSAAGCPHVVLVPRWDNADDIGKSEVASSYVCEACTASFPREEAERLQAEGAERVRRLNVKRLDEQ